MKMNLIGLHVFTVMSLFLSAFSSLGQTESTSQVKITANVDLVSRYIWRGLDIGHAPSIQPGIAVQWNEFKLGAWGAYKLTGAGGQETDFYLSKTVGFATLALWDYWSFNDTTTLNFFDYQKKTTSHLLEEQLLLSGGKAFPVSFLASYFFHGSDVSKSLYFELQYERKLSYVDMAFFAGYQAKGTYYASSANFVNVGCTLKKSIPVTDRLSFPVYLSLIVNPASKTPYLVAGITF